MKILRLLLKIILPLVILGAAVFFGKTLLSHRQIPITQPRQNLGALVELALAQPESRKVTVIANGTVTASRETAIVTQVSGVVMTLSKNMKDGAFLRQGEILFSLEKIDYQLAVEQAHAGIIRAESALTTIESKARVARFDWQRLHPDTSEQPSPLALYLPQLDEARANLAAARATLTRAETDLARTEITAPFNCRVKQESLEIGQYVKSGASVAVLVGTDTAEIVVPVPLTDLGLLDVPSAATPQSGAAADIRIADASASQLWHGRVVRSLGEVDPKGRMVRLVVEVNDPYAIATDHTKATPLLPGMFVEVSLSGGVFNQIFVLPRRSFREHGTVWIADSENRLRIRPVETVREQQQEIWINKGLTAGDRIILTNLAGAADGLLVRPASEGGPK